MHTPGVYDPKFEAALAELLMAAADTAEFASGERTGRSRQASLRRLRQALADLESVSRAVMLETAVVSASDAIARLRSASARSTIAAF